MPQLLTNATTQAAGASQSWGGGSGSFEASGTFNGSTVTLQRLAADGTWFDVPNTALTATGRMLFLMEPGQIRANVSVAAPTSVSSAAWRTRNP
jgi:hypothetical protein